MLQSKLGELCRPATALALGVGAVAVYVAVKRCQKSTSNNPYGLPGPAPSDPELGNLTDMAAAGGVHGYVMKLHNEYKSNMVVFWWAKIPVVSLGSEKLLQAVGKLTHRPKQLFEAFEPMITPHSIQYAQGEEWAKRRRHLDHHISRSAMNQHPEDMIEVSKWVVKHVSETIADKKEATVMARELMFTFAFRSYILFAFGDLFRQEDEIAKLMAAYNFSWKEMELRVAGEPATEERLAQFEAALQVFRDSADRSIAARRKVAEAGEDITLFLDDLTANFPDEVVFGEFITFLVGGSHTTGNAATWVLYYLAQYPEKQEAIRQELIKAGATPEDVNLDHADSSVELDMFYNETLRMRVIASYAARQNVDGPFTLGGKEFPKDTVFLKAFGPCFGDTEKYPNPHEFNPERFRPREGQKRYPFKLPFGTGARACPGYQLTVTTTKLNLANLIMNYRFHLAGSAEEVVPFYGFVCSPTKDFGVTFERR